MSYGSSEWSDWLISDEQEVFKHIKFAYDHGIQTFDTANVYKTQCISRSPQTDRVNSRYTRTGFPRPF